MYNKKNFPYYLIGDTINKYIKETYDIDIASDLDIPNYEIHGEYTTNVALRISKITKQNPKTIADEICGILTKEIPDTVLKCEVAGPGFVNIFLTNDARTEIIKAMLMGDSVFETDSEQGKKWVIEHTSPNPNKAMHLGHLRNNLVGMSLYRMIKNAGGEVVLNSVDNNRGIAIAKAMYGFLALEKKDSEAIEHSKPPLSKDISPLTRGEDQLQSWIDHPENWYSPEEKGMRPDVFVTNCYTGGEELRKNDETGTIDKLIRKMVLDWEAKDANTWVLWRHILNYSYAGMEMTLARLGNKWDKIWHEHEHYEIGKEYVEKGLQQGIFKKLEDGAVLTQIEEAYNIPETILLKNDGTALYITQDIALTDLRKRQYNADKLVWVIGPEQTLAMRQLFAVCEQLGIGKLSDFIHISYGYMGLKDEDGNFKKMSSRDGSVLLIDDLIDAVKEKIKTKSEDTENKAKQSTTALSSDDSEEALREKLALGAIKFSILKCEKNMNMAFDINESVNLTGDSGIYVMYTFARINSIIQIAKERGVHAEAKTGQIAASIIRMLGSYPIVMHSSHEHLSVHPIAHYLLSLCSSFNKFYAEERILGDEQNLPEKLAILEAVNNTISHGLGLMGIETVDRM